MQQRKRFRKGTLVFRHENGHYPSYVVVSGHSGKFSLALPWSPEETVLREVDGSELEKVFGGSLVSAIACRMTSIVRMGDTPVRSSL